MKKITITLILVIGAIAIFAQSPQAFKYQAVVRDNAGDILANKSVSFRMSIHDSAAGGVIEYQETHGLSTNEFGLANLEIGNGTPVSGDFSTIDWADGPKYLEVELDTASGTNYVSMGTSELLSVPFALYAENAGSGADNDWTENGNDLYNNNSGNVGIGTTTPGAKLEVAGHISQTGTGNSVFLGEGAGMNDDGSDNNNSFVGYKSGNLNSSGYSNSCFGNFSGNSNTTGGANSFVGYRSGFSNTTGGWNSFFGLNSGSSNTTGNDNSFFGYLSGYSNITGMSNSFVGSFSGISNTTGSYNLFLGSSSGYSNTTGDRNIFIGNKAGYFETGNNKLYIESSDADSANALIYGEFDNDLLVLNASVGIGTTTPDAELHVNGAMRLGTGVRDFEIIEVDPSYPDGWSSLISYGGIGIGSNTHINRQMVLFTDGATSGNDNIFTVATSDDDGASWEADFVVTQNGNVGIGLTDPNRKLYIRHTVDSLSFPLKIENKYGLANESAVGILFSAGGSGANERGKGSLVYQYKTTWNRGDFHFLQNTAPDESNPDLNDAVLTIKNNGNVGIGTTNPAVPLEVHYNSGEPTVLLSRAVGQASIKSIYGHLMLESNGTAIGLNWYGTDDVILAKGGGNVGIGTDNPNSYMLYCNGTAAKPGGGSWSNPSDKNLKDIHGKFERGLNELLQLSPVSYNYKTNNELELPSDEEYIGLVAQEVQKVIPEAVEEMESGYLSVNNDPIIWTMLNAIKEQNNLIKELMDENQEMKERINKLENNK